jgi:hypothetical protein
MYKVIPFFKSFTTIFYFNFLELGEIIFEPFEFGNGLNRLTPPPGTELGPYLGWELGGEVFG